MNVLLLCDKTVPELFPLMGELPVAQLPLLGKTIAEYHLELVCAALEPQQLSLWGGSYQASLRQLLGDGTRWGVALNYQQSLSLRQDLPLLVLPCDRLSSFDLGLFLQQAQEQPEQSAVGMVLGTPAVYWIAKQEDWREVVGGSLETIGTAMELSASVTLKVDSIKAFYDANLGLLRGSFRHIKVTAYEQGESLLLASRASISPSVQSNGRAYVGAGSRIKQGAALLGYCVVARQVLVDAHATLEDCVILPNSYVGSWVSIRNAVVSGAYVWRMDTGINFRVDERFLLSQLPVIGKGNWLSRLFGHSALKSQKIA